MITEAIRKVVAGETLTRDEAAQAMEAIMGGAATPAQIAGLLTALRVRGEREEEIAGFAETMRRFAVPVSLDLATPVVDTCGTGGDGGRTFNVSTAAAFVVAGAGVPVAKHGNRAMSSASGSADVLEALGVRIDLGPEAVAHCVREAGIGFMFAQRFHPAMRHAAPVRRELGIRTVFNVLGPLTNPAGVRHQLVGVAMPDMVETVARVLALLGVSHALVVHATDGLDELSLSAPTLVYDVRTNGMSSVRTFTIEPESLGIPAAPLSTVRGGTAQENALMIRRILSGEERGPARAITVLNAAAALYAADAVESIAEGIARATAAIDSGAAQARLEALVRLSQSLAETEAGVA
ncbi:anthranilate phosphoribosyltransferase [Thermorudis peleae]|uniref:anthranilate phosphoribosyltransferase n=1 Tax=Thermorudis peleae TaxID=1382356 RepID=UPI0005719C1D|nr:anthranilate phosphoribosyltransferase [Thermorudis peleae]